MLKQKAKYRQPLLMSLKEELPLLSHTDFLPLKADRIFVFEDGKIVEEGNFKALMKTKGKFYELAKHQIALF